MLAIPTSACYSHGWGGTGETYGCDILPNVHLGLVCNHLGQLQPGVNYSDWEPSAKKNNLRSVLTCSYALNINRNHMDAGYFTLSKHFLSDLNQ